MNEAIKHYSPLEERLNIYSHGAGFVLSLVAAVLLMLRAFQFGNVWHLASAAAFALGLLALYAASTLYHSATQPQRRSRLRIFDHAAIYLLIAGTYTPFVLITLKGPVGWSIFAAAWGMAVTGIVLKLFFTGRYNTVSTLMYVFMGWIIIFAIKPLAASLPSAGLYWLIAGGVSYTVGAIIYAINRVPMNHAAFHIFVLAGSACHFMAVYYYVLPSR